MNNLTGSEKQVSWAMQIKETVLTYAQEEIAFEQERLTRYTDVEDIEIINNRIAEINAKIEKLNNVTEARIFIDYLKDFSKVISKEDFAAKNPKLNSQQLDDMYQLTRAQLAGACVGILIKCKQI